MEKLKFYTKEFLHHRSNSAGTLRNTKRKCAELTPRCCGLVVRGKGTHLYHVDTHINMHTYMA